MIRRAVLPLLLLLIVVAAFWPVMENGFINLDDPGYIFRNVHVTSGLSVQNTEWALLAMEMQNWHPLTWLSHQADAEMFGLNPAGHHFTSLLLHACSTVLLFLFLYRATGAYWQSGFVAALFGIHPLHVESVAWAAERKDVLSGLFWMLTLLAYARYVARPQAARYGLVVTMFLFGLLAKPMLVTLPFVLLLLDYWPFERVLVQESVRPGRCPPASLARAGLEKVPLLALAAASSIITVYAQRGGGAISTLGEVPATLRVSNAVVSGMSYVVKMFWPTNLSILYPLDVSLPAWKIAGSALILLSCSYLAIRLAKRHPYLCVGWFWYLGTLIPVIGIVHVGSQAMADRYTYLPLIGLFVMIAFGVPTLLARFRHRTQVLAAAGAVTLLPCAYLTHARIADWRDDMSIFTQALRVTERNLVVHYNLGVALAEKGRNDEAVAQYLEAIRINPDFAEGYYSLGNQMMQATNDDEALRLYREAIRLNPSHAAAHNNAGLVLERLGRNAEAIVQLQQAVGLSPGGTGMRYNLAMALFRAGRREEAAQQCVEVLRAEPDHRQARMMLEYISGPGRPR